MKLKDKYYLVGKISYSNKEDYIGKFIKVSRFNYDRLVNQMNAILKPEFKFQENKDKFLFHFYEIEEGIGIDSYVIGKKYELKVVYNLSTMFDFEILYDSRYSPIEIFFYENIFKYKELNKLT